MIALVCSTYPLSFPSRPSIDDIPITRFGLPKSYNLARLFNISRSPYIPAFLRLPSPPKNVNRTCVLSTFYLHRSQLQSHSVLTSLFRILSRRRSKRHRRLLLPRAIPAKNGFSSKKWAHAASIYSSRRSPIPPSAISLRNSNGSWSDGVQRQAAGPTLLLR